MYVITEFHAIAFRVTITRRRESTNGHGFEDFLDSDGSGHADGDCSNATGSTTAGTYVQ